MLRRMILSLAVITALIAVGVASATSPQRSSKPGSPACGGGQNYDTVYSAVLDFEPGWRAGTNPNGVWRYGWSSSLTSPIKLFTAPTVNGLAPQEHIWLDPDFNLNYAPFAGRNSGGDYEDGLRMSAGAFMLHPGPDGTYAHVVWTAPTFGQFIVAVTFYAQQENINVDVAVLVKGAVKFSNTITSIGQSHKFAERFLLKAGDTVDFAVGPNGIPYLHEGHTGLELAIIGELAE